MSQDFNKGQVYQVWLRGESLKLFLEGVEKYLDYLSQHMKPGNTAIQAKHSNALWLREALVNRIKGIEQDWQMRIVAFAGEPWQQLKSTLPYLLADVLEEREALLNKGVPNEAAEYLDAKIAKLKELMETGFFSTVPIIDLMGKPKEEASFPKRDANVVFDKELRETVREVTERAETNDRAIDDAVTVVEDRIRELANLPDDCVGEDLINKAFNPKGGILRFDSDKLQLGYWKLFSGYLSVIRNITAHKRIRGITPERAQQIILFSDFLLGELDKIKPSRKK